MSNNPSDPIALMNWMVGQLDLPILLINEQDDILSCSQALSDFMGIATATKLEPAQAIYSHLQQARTENKAAMAWLTQTQDKAALFSIFPFLIGPNRYCLVYMHPLTAWSRTEKSLLLVIKTLEQAIMIDALTGAYNRHYLHKELSTLLLAAQKNKTPMSLIMLDIDHFKQVNDKHGHMAGDEVLKSSAQLLKSKLRSSDALIRYGGEEFLVLLPDTRLGNAEETAERMRELLETTKLAHGKQQIQVTASFGIVEFDPDCDDIDSLLKRVDQALYAAKNAGRNCVVTKTNTASRGQHTSLV